jgi:hypothetical protein
MDQEYQKLLADLYSSNKDNLYQQLIEKETEVLKTINKAANADQRDNILAGHFVHMPVMAVIQRMYEVLNDIGRELPKTKDMQDIVKVVRKSDRIIYIGVTLVIIAMFLLVVQGD